ncbi:COG complex component [Pterulicium gracile]|uniref:Conserved oligomeric Golgi complex subunit 2 n=1 Tax=Pterulicium gracile TaxID=1884261 RepID=A0A5C3QRE2_9AGAR|nr:COG complex component [Pterula gracilis]
MAPGPPSSSRDRFELDRLAEELETRQSNQKFGDAELDHQDYELPTYVPLSHDNSELNAEVFDVERFLLSRSHTSLPDLRTELRDYLAILKEELVKLINDDYEAFISLSTDLKGEGARLQRLKAPLSTVRGEVFESRKELQAIQDAIQDKLRSRAALREEQNIVQLLLKISDSLTRIESLLHIVPNEESDSPENSASSMPSYLRPEQEGTEDKNQNGYAKHLGRVAAEYTQLLYHASKARSSSCAFIDEVQWRIDRIQSSLSSDLDHLLSTTVKALVDGKAGGKNLSEMDKATWTAELSECLRTYDTLGLWRDAEDVLRRDVMRAFIKKTIYHGTLTNPHSPLLPHTPFESSHPPRTPYTPFTAFASKKNPFEVDYFTQSQSLLQIPLLDEGDDHLARVYNQMLRFVDRDLSKVMTLAEKVSVKAIPASIFRSGLVPTTAPPPSALDASEGDDKGFRILANVVWAELGTAIMDELGSVVFAAGKPDEFRKHYETTTSFLRALEYLAPSVHAIEAMRAHPVYIAFGKRWQLPVYYQLRWKDITTKLETALSRTTMTTGGSKELYQPFVTAQASAVYWAVSSCWSAEVFIPALGHAFWKLTLQILSRYYVWLQKVLPDLETIPQSTTSEKNAGPHISRPGTPAQSEATPTAESSAVDETALAQMATALSDIQTMCRQVEKLWKNEISLMLDADVDPTAIDDEEAKPEDILQQHLSALQSFIPPMSLQVINILTRRCNIALLEMRSIPSRIRAISNKRLPSEPSPFVEQTLKPVKVFFGVGVGEGPATGLKDQLLGPFGEEIFENVCQRYIYYLSNMRKTEESLRRLKKGRKTTFSLFGGGGNAKDDDGKDEERIRTQMILDVNAFGKDAQALGVQLEKSETFGSLRDMVHRNFVDDEAA